jgi:hypothetical protein
MSGPKRAVLFILIVFQGFCGSQGFAQQTNWSIGLGPVLSDTLLSFAVQHANIARQFEARGQYGPAQAEYQQVIDNAIAAAQQRTGDLREATSHYVVGLAEIDHARMFLSLHVEHLFANEYFTDLMRADQELRIALGLYGTQGAPTWQVYSALAVVQTLSGDFAGALASTQQVQILNPQEQGAHTASQLLAAPPPQVAQAAAAVRSKQGFTPEQWLLLGGVVEKVAILTLPRFGKTGSVIIAGIELAKALLSAPHP